MILPVFPEDVKEINSLVGCRKEEDKIYYFIGQLPIYSHDIKDIKSFRFITTQLVVNGNVTQMEIVRAFGISKISMKRYVKKYREEGIAGFFNKKRMRSATVLTSEVKKEIQDKLDEGMEVSSISEKMGIKADTIRKSIRENQLYKATKKISEK